MAAENNETQANNNETQATETETTASYSVGDAVQHGRYTGTVTDILPSGPVRVRLEDGRVLKIDSRLLKPAEVGAADAKSVRPGRNKAVLGPAETK